MLSLYENLSPHIRVVAAIVPFLIAITMRIVLGRTRLTRIAVQLGAMWFMANVLMTPYTLPMRQDIHELRYVFR